MNEDAMLRAAHPMYDSFCREDDEREEYDEMERGEAMWEQMDER